MRCDSGGVVTVQASGGPTEVAFLGDGHEVAQPAQVDAFGHRRERYRVWT